MSDTHKLQSYDNPNSCRYSILMELQREYNRNWGMPPTNYVIKWWGATDSEPRLVSFLEGVLKGQVLVDLGCGRGGAGSPYGSCFVPGRADPVSPGYRYVMPDIAKESSASGYVGVDFMNSRDVVEVATMALDIECIPHPELLARNRRKCGVGEYAHDPTAQSNVDLPAHFSPMDFYLFCEDMLTFTSRLATGSVNFTIIGIDDCVIFGGKKSPYGEALAEEVTRATRDDGVLLMNDLCIIIPFLGPEFSRLKVPGLGRSLVVYQKNFGGRDSTTPADDNFTTSQ